MSEGTRKKMGAARDSEPSQLEKFRAYHAQPGADLNNNSPDRLHHVLLNLQEYLLQATIERGEYVRDLPEGERQAATALESAEIKTALGQTRFDCHVREEQSRIDGVIALKHGRVIYEAYPRMRPRQRHSYQSVNKPVLSLALSILRERGLFDPDLAVEAYLPDFAGSGWEGVRVLDVLDHTSGIAALEHSEGARSDPDHLYYQFEHRNGWFDHGSLVRPSTREHLSTLPRRIEPGTVTEYTSVNSVVLGYIAEEISGLPLHELIAQEIWQPAGAEGDAFMVITPKGSASTDGGMSSTLRDMARYALLYTPSGRNGVSAPPVTDRHLEEIRTGGRPDIYAKGYGAQFADEADPPMHLSWHWDRIWRDGDFYKGGWSGQGVYISPARDVVLAWFGCADPDLGRNDMPAICRQIIGHL